jgi:hypothetical protein
MNNFTPPRKSCSPQQFFFHKTMWILQLTLLLSFFGCNQESYKPEGDVEASAVVSNAESVDLRSDDGKSDVLIKYYQNGVAIHHMESGEFVFCQVCFSDLEDLPKDEIVGDAVITIDLGLGEIQLFDAQKNLFRTFSKSLALEGAPVLGIGIAFGYYPRGNSDFSYLSTNGVNGPPVMEVDCQCVHQTSTPCTPSGGNANGCDVGGEGATSCGVNYGVTVTTGMTIVGTGASGGGGSTQGCSIGCDATLGLYACCNY